MRGNWRRLKSCLCFFGVSLAFPPFSYSIAPLLLLEEYPISCQEKCKLK